jgi:hypothetical protein
MPIPSWMADRGKPSSLVFTHTLRYGVVGIDGCAVEQTETCSEEKMVTESFSVGRYSTYSPFRHRQMRCQDTHA